MPAEDRDPCEILEWDSAFFGFRIARVRGSSLTPERVSEIDAWCGRRGVACVYFLSRSDDPATTRLAEDNGFHLVDIRMTFRCTPAAGPTDSFGAVRPARPEDVPVLEAIARECYQDTRFFCDPKFPGRLSVSLYETWIRRSCEGFAEAVLVSEVEDGPVGYISCHLSGQPTAGRIGLVGVSSLAKGRGVGRTLVGRALEWFRAQGAREVFVVTQGRNYAAQCLYQRCGFLTHVVELWYHKWYACPDPARE